MAVNWTTVFESYNAWFGERVTDPFVAETVTEYWLIAKVAVIDLLPLIVTDNGFVEPEASPLQPTKW